MTTYLLLLASLSLFSLGYSSNNTITDEAWFEILIRDHPERGEDFRGRFVIGLFGDVAPMTVMNFVAITKGYVKKSAKLHYKNSPIHRVVPDFVIQMGDVISKDGTGGSSIYGPQFNDEEFILSHKAPGYVSMANHGSDTNGSQFFIILNKARWLDKKHVVFGKVIRGMVVVRQIGEVEADPNNALPKKEVKIVDCGINDLEKKYDITPKQAVSGEDIM